MMQFLRLFLLVAALTLSAHAELSLHVADKEPPKELDPSIRSLLQPKAIQLRAGDKPVYEFWLGSKIPLPTLPGAPRQALDAVKQATLMGAVAVSRSQRDYRDDEVYVDVYTMRFALQPQDGNHLGTSEHPYFLVLVPAKLDRAPDAITNYKKLVQTSGRETATGHPIILSLRPVSSAEGEFPSLNEPLPDHRSIRLKVPCVAGEKEEPANLMFELVYEGMGHK